MIKILILGGTGYIGTILTKYLSEHNIQVFPKGTVFYKTERIKDISIVKTFIEQNEITHVIDLTRFTAKSLVGFYSLIKYLKNITYIHLTSYSLIDPKVYEGCSFDKIEIDVANKINKYLKDNNYKYYSFITPLIVNNIDSFEVSDMSTVKTNYTYVCNEKEFVEFVLNNVLTEESGIYEVPAVKRIFR